MRRPVFLWVFSVVFGFTGGQGFAYADEPQYVPKAGEETQKPSQDMGFNPWFTIGANVSFGHNRSVVGKADGQTWTLGGSLDSGFDYQVGSHDWRNRLQVLETFTYGPPINEFVKSADQIIFSSDYYFKIASIPWFGPFARFQLDTSLFPGEDVQPTYQTQWSKGGRIVRTGKRIQLTEPLLPLNLKEVVGLFARPFSRPFLEWGFRAGFGSIQVFAEGQMALTGAMTDVNKDGIQEREIVDLHSYVQGGLEFGTTLQGKVLSQLVGYQAFADAMTPFIRQKRTGDNRGALRMTNVSIGLQISFGLTSWASLDYQFRAVRQPQLVEVFQVQNLLLLTFKHSPVEKRQPPE